MCRSNEIDVKTFMRQNKKIPIRNASITYVSTREYAALTGKHKITILKWLEQGMIEGAYKMGGQWQIPIIKAQ